MKSNNYNPAADQYFIEKYFEATEAIREAVRTPFAVVKSNGTVVPCDTVEEVESIRSEDPSAFLCKISSRLAPADDSQLREEAEAEAAADGVCNEPAEAQEPAEKDYFRNGYYDYLEAVTDDVEQYIRDEVNMQDFADRDELEEYLNDELWTADGVTGNASGSYYCNTWKAEEALCHNLDLLAEACSELGCSGNILEEGAETCDITIRCYLLSQAIAEALDDMKVFDNE